MSRTAGAKHPEKQVSNDENDRRRNDLVEGILDEALNHPQKSHSSFGTIKNGIKMGPTRTQTAVAIKPKAMTTIVMACAAARKIIMMT